MRRVFAKPVPLSKTERKRLHKLQARYDALVRQASADDEMPAKAAEQLGRIEAAIEALQQGGIQGAGHCSGRSLRDPCR